MTRSSRRTDIARAALVCALLSGLIASGGCEEASSGRPLGIEGTANDAGPDAVIEDASPALTDDAQAPPSDVGGEDGGAEGCGLCAPSDSCHEALCVDNECVQQAVADGLPCSAAEDMICVAGVCTVRECGDGYREPGPTPPREGCDDGNTVDGDACDTACSPLPLIIASRPAGHDATVGSVPALAASGSGDILAVWLADTGEADAALEIRARRFTPGGTAIDALDDPLIVAPPLPFGWPLEPTVAGLGDGWVIAWSDPRDEGRATYRRVALDGTTWAAREAWADGLHPQRQARVAPVGDGFVVVWTDERLWTGEGARVQARHFDSRGRPLSAPFMVSDGFGHDVDPAIASAGSRWIVAWTDAEAAVGTWSHAVEARRFDDDTPLDAGFVVSDGSGRAPVATALGSDDWAVAWESVELDTGGDVLARRVNGSGMPTEGTLVEAVAMDPEVDETSPLIVARGEDGFVVGWHAPSDGGVGLVELGVLGIAPETTALESLIAPPRIRGGASATASSRGVWFVWSARGGPGDPTAQRSVLAFLLPPE